MCVQCLYILYSKCFTYLLNNYNHQNMNSQSACLNIEILLDIEILFKILYHACALRFLDSCTWWKVFSCVLDVVGQFSDSNVVMSTSMKTWS